MEEPNVGGVLGEAMMSRLQSGILPSRILLTGSHSCPSTGQECMIRSSLSREPPYVNWKHAPDIISEPPPCINPKPPPYINPNLYLKPLPYIKPKPHLE